MASPIKFQSEVTNIIKHSDDVITVEFQYLGRKPRYKPGQFLHLTLDQYDPTSHWPESRVFTIAKGPADKESIRLSIAEKGKYTHRILNELKVGSVVWMKAPYGEFIIKSVPNQDVVLIAGGTGVSPFVAFMENSLVKGLNGPVWLHYGARTPDLLIFKDLSDECDSKFDDFKVDYYVEDGAKDKFNSGRIDLEKVCKQLKDPSNSIYYLCGPLEMIRIFQKKLEEDFNVAPENIKIDDWD